MVSLISEKRERTRHIGNARREEQGKGHDRGKEFDVSYEMSRPRLKWL